MTVLTTRNIKATGAFAAPRRNRLGRRFAIGIAPGLTALCFALGLGNPVATAQSPPTPAAAAPQATLRAGTNEHLFPPVPSAPKSPVENFRELLAMNLAERKKALADKSPEAQKAILAKVREYESMNADLRELRLRATELRWYLLPLMRTAPSNRVERLQQLSPENRELVESRLKEWDKLTPEVQKELLDNEATLRYFTELDVASPTISEARRRQLQKGIAAWQTLPEEQRRKIAQRFNEYFELTPSEKQKALQTVSDPERHQMEKTLRSFGRLTPLQRSQCLKSFDKFASLSIEERQQFLKNAERWKLMTPSERQSWRRLVHRLELEPPLPTSFSYPPLPPSPKKSVPRSGVAQTNP